MGQGVLVSGKGEEASSRSRRKRSCGPSARRGSRLPMRSRSSSSCLPEGELSSGTPPPPLLLLLEVQAQVTGASGRGRQRRMMQRADAPRRRSRSGGRLRLQAEALDRARGVGAAVLTLRTSWTPLAATKTMAAAVRGTFQRVMSGDWRRGTLPLRRSRIESERLPLLQQLQQLQRAALPAQRTLLCRLAALLLPALHRTARRSFCPCQGRRCSCRCCCHKAHPSPRAFRK